MLNRYLIFERYEYWGKQGKSWTPWFIILNTPYAKTKEELNNTIKELYKSCADIDKCTKLKHEYDIRMVDVDTLPRPSIEYSKKGRPSKAEIEKQQYKYNNYWKLRIDDYDKQYYMV